MARPREFDHDEVLYQAMVLFWRQGYAATSIAQLCDAMGISRQSLYDSFGDKHALFLAAIDRYCAMMSDQVLAGLMAPDAALPELHQAAVGVIDFLVQFPDRPACLMANTTLEVAARDPAVAAKIKAYNTAMETAFTHALGNARRRGQIAANAAPAALARYLVGVHNGLIVAAKSGAAREELEATLAIAVGALQPT